MEKDAKIYVAGHRGLVGSSIVRALQREGYTNIVTATRQEVDLLNQQAVVDFFAKKKTRICIPIGGQGRRNYGEFPMAG
jgi:GDP-L-fucose synthase